MAKMKPKIETPPVKLKPLKDLRRDAEYRAYDGVVPMSSGGIPPCIFGKQEKPAESCKVKLFFAGPDTAQELSAATGQKYEPGAYLRVCGPKTNSKVEVIPAGDVATGMKRADSVCGCVEEAGSDGSACVKKASGLAGVPKRRRRAKRSSK